MKIIRLIKKRINDIEPNADMLKAIKAQCGIEVKAKVKIPLYKRTLFRVLTPVMACFLLAVTCTSVIFALPRNSSTTSYILLELGSQVQFVAKDNTVVSQQALNPEAQILLLGCDYVDENVDDAIVDVVQNAEELGMIAEGDAINIATVVDSSVEHNKKNSIYSSMNNAQEKLGGNYELSCTFSGRNGLVDSVALKYACSEDSIDNKNIIDLIKIYVNYDSIENQKYEYNLNNEYENIWEQTQADMNADSQYNSYKDLANNLNIVITNLELLQNDFDQKICDAVSIIIDDINGNYDNMLGDFNPDEEFLKMVKDKSQIIKEEINETIQLYYDQFEQDIMEFKRNLYSTIYSGNVMSQNDNYTMPNLQLVA